MTAPRHFLDLDQIEAPQLRFLIERGKAYKRGDAGGGARPLDGKTLAMIFEKPSTRTRVSFEAGMRQLGGSVIVLDQQRHPTRPRRNHRRHRPRAVALCRCDHDPHQRSGPSCWSWPITPACR